MFYRRKKNKVVYHELLCFQIERAGFSLTGSSGRLSPLSQYRRLKERGFKVYILGSLTILKKATL
jgi:hypothetical protein